VFSTSNEALREVAIAGLGIVLHSLWDGVQAGVLAAVRLEDLQPSARKVWVIWRGPTGRARLFINALVEFLPPSEQVYPAAQWAKARGQRPSF
jgi:DNA-binding transcriptional LysR family regulator